MRSLLFWFFLIGCLVPLTELMAQETVFGYRSYGVREGLPHRNVKLVFFDRDGICWAATNFHLNRIDGSSIKSYGKEKIGPAADNIQAIQQDEQGRLWLWAATGCHLFNPYTEEAERLEEALQVESGLLSQVNAAPPSFPLQLKNGDLVFNPGTRAYLIRYAANGVISQKSLDLPEPFQLLAPLGTSSYWARTGNQVVQIDGSGKITSSATYLGLNHATVVSQAPEFAYVFTTTGGDEEPFGFYRQGANGQLEDLRKEWKLDGLRRVYWEKAKQLFWIELDEKWELRSEDGALMASFPDQRKNRGLYQAVSYSWMAQNDEFGGLWIATENGLTHTYSIDSPFENYFTGQEAPEPLSIRGIWASRDTVIAAAELDGTFMVSPEGTEQIGGQYHQYIAGRGLKTSNSYELPADFRGLHRAKSGRLWLGQQRVAISYDPSTDEYQTYPPAFEYDKAAGGLNPWCFHDQENGTIWVGLQAGAGLILPGQDSILRVDPGEQFADLNQAVVYSIQEDEKGVIWMGTDKGLFKFNAAGKCLDRFWAEGEGNRRLPFDNIYHFYPARNGRFWIATAGNGLLIFDPNSGYYNQWTRKEGLSDQLLYAVYADDSGIPWVTSDYGLMRIDTLNSTITTWLTKDGLPHHEFNRGGHFMDAEGRMYFGGLAGIVSFHPRDLKGLETRSLPPIRISTYQLWKDGESLPRNLLEELVKDSTITFGLNDENFYLEFSLIDYHEPANKYAYRIGDELWTELSSNSLRISHVPYGSYPLEIRAQLDNGRWTTNNLRLTLNVEKPFYHEAGFWAFLLLLFIGGIVGISNWRIRLARNRSEALERSIALATTQIRSDKALIEEQAAELKELDNLKTRFFANVSHELRTPLTLILGPIQSLLSSNPLQNKEKLYLKLAHENAKELLLKINSILDLAKLDVNGVELKPVPTNLYAMIRSVLGNFESRADLQKVTLLYEYQGDRNLSFQLDQEKLTTIINNLLANALRFTPTNGKVMLVVEDRPDCLLICVKDNGAGIKSSDLPFVFDRFFQSSNQANTTGGSGIGLALCWELVQLHSGKIWVESEVGNGTVFFIELPRREVIGGPFSSPNETTIHHTVNQAINPVEDLVATKEDTESPLLLLVEDNTSLLNYLQTIMSGIYRIRKATNGLAALAYLKENPDQHPDLIITDLMMPEMDGFQLIEAVKSDASTRLIPIIVLTAKSSADDRIRALRFGIDDYVAKPFSEEELLVRVERLLESASKRKKALEVSDVIPNEPAEKKAQWLLELEELVINEMNNDLLSASFLAERNFVSVRQLQRNLKKEVGLTTGEYIREVRLNEALRFLETREFASVKEVAHRVGFQSVEYFSTRFKARFGRLPSSYL